MIFSYNWLQKHFKKSLPDPYEIAELLSLHSFEVEQVAKVKLPQSGKSDFTLDIDVLPNRAHDCLSHSGVAREIGMLLGIGNRPPIDDIELKTSDRIKTSGLMALSVQDANAVPRAMKRLMIDIKVGPSPDWLKNALESVGQRSINNVVDAANYVMLETGQPVHTFDFDKLASTGGGEKKNISIKFAENGERITLLDDETVELDDTMLVIHDGEKSLDIAGIKGGAVSGIGAGTRRVALSVCNFDPVSIRETSKKLKLKTDASKRFEQGITPELASYAIDRLSALIQSVAGGDVASDVLDEYPKPVSKRTIPLSTSDVEKLLGVDIAKPAIVSILRKLGCGVDSADGLTLTVTPPFERLDLTIQEDLIEEVGRIYGYENIKAVAPRRSIDPPKRNEIMYYSHIVRGILAAAGFSEVYTYSMAMHGGIEIRNPVSKERAFMRESLIPGLQYANGKNLKYAKEVRIFELAHVFPSGGSDEYTSLAAMSGGVGCSPSEGFYEMKGVVETIAEELGINNLFFVDSKRPDLLAEIHIDNMEIGTICHNSFELDLDLLIEAVNDEIEFRPISKYPNVSRDLSLFVPSGTKVVSVLDVIENTAGELLVDTDLFDTFEKSGRKSFAFHLTFQSHSKTLTDKEVNAIMGKIYEALRDTDSGWEIR